MIEAQYMAAKDLARVQAARDMLGNCDRVPERRELFSLLNHWEGRLLGEIPGCVDNGARPIHNDP